MMAETTDPGIIFPPQQYPDEIDKDKSVNRRLGAYESLLEDGQRLNGFMINVNYLLVRSANELGMDQIKAALKKLQKRVTALRLVITGVGENKFFKECSKLGLNFESVCIQSLHCGWSFHHVRDQQILHGLS
jgi:hypothetical protein